MHFRYFVIISPWKRTGSFIWKKTFIPSPWNDTLFLTLLQLAIRSGEEKENVKSLKRQQRRRTTDKLWSEKLIWAFGSGELKTKLNGERGGVQCADPGSAFGTHHSTFYELMNVWSADRKNNNPTYHKQNLSYLKTTPLILLLHNFSCYMNCLYWKMWSVLWFEH